MPNDTAREPLVLDHERLYEEAERLEDARKITLDGVTTYSGKHPLYGLVHLVFPAFGPGLMLVASFVAMLMCVPLVQFSLLLPILSLSAL